MNLAYLAPLANHLWQSTVFAAAAGLLTLALRNNPARVRHWVWLAASCKFLIPISLLIALGGHIHWRTAPETPVADLSFVMDRVTQPFSITVLPSAFPAPSPAANPLPAILLGIWACGLVGIAWAWGVRWRRIRTAVHAGSPLPLELPIRAVSSPTLMEPGVFGIFRPVLVLPDGIFESLTLAQLKAVIEHELCHVRHRDTLASAIHMLVETVFWFHPLMWWIGTRMIEERERACDEEVIEHGAEPRDYAEGILQVCKLYAESRLACVAGVTGANLKKRIQAIMDRRLAVRLNRSRKAMLAFAAAIALACPIAVGVMIGIGNTPAIHAQSAPPQRDTPPSPRRDTPTQAAQTAPAPAKQASDHRRIAMFFDLDVMTHDDQVRAQQAIPAFLGNEMQPGDLVAVLTSSESRISVLQDFTADRGPLESAVAKIASMAPSTSSAFVLSRLESAVRPLGAIEGKKFLMYFSNRIERIEQARTKDPASWQGILDAAVRANVVLSLVDTARLAAAQAPNRLPQDAAAATPTPDAASIKPSQNRPAPPKYTYEVVSIHRADPAQTNSGFSDGPQGGLRARNVTAMQALTFAYGVQDYQILDAPGWAHTERFEISLTPDRPEILLESDTSRTEYDGWRTRQSQRMQAVLRDRFSLVLRTETRDLPMYFLAVAKNGHKLKTPAHPERLQTTNFNNGRQIVGTTAPMKSLAEMLSMVLRRPVRDETGLDAAYDFKMDFAPDSTGPLPDRAAGPDQPAPTADSTLPSIFTSITEQLGLRLEARKGPVPVFVVEKIQRPSEN